MNLINCDNYILIIKTRYIYNKEKLPKVLLLNLLKELNNMR